LATQKSILIMGPADADCTELLGHLKGLGHATRTRVTASDLIVNVEEPDVDLYVVALPRSVQVAATGPGNVGRSARKRVLYVTADSSDVLRRELFRAGAGGVLAQPVGALDVQYAASQILASDWARFRKQFDEAAMLDFLKQLLDRRLDVIEPSLDPTTPAGHFYPEVARILGRTPMDRECLETLASLGLLARETANRVRMCPECDDSRLSFREACPNCKSLNIQQQEMVTHFACAFSAPLQHFRRGGDLVCPKCNQILRHIGVDYEKPSKLFTCFACETVFRDPTVEAQCLRCNCVCTPGQTIERTVYRFLVTPLAEQAVIEGHITGVNLEVLLRNTQTGLYSKSYFEHEVRRELVRFERYKSPFCLLLVRVNHFDEITTMHPSEAARFAESIFKAVSSGLRVLDTTCVWSMDTLGVLLSETPKANAGEVVRRVHDNVQKLEYLYSIRKPSVSIGVTSNEDGLKSLADLTAAAIRNMRE
jgi:diguanylate cyclase (GGDEF)-like protein